MSFKDEIKMDRLPGHVAIIMDGNGRWAKKKGNQRIFGHQNGVKAVRDTVEAAAELGLGYLTLYAFSTENWNRPRTEIDALMALLVSTLNSEKKTLLDNNVQLQAIGDLKSLPGNVGNQLNKVIEETSVNDGLKLILALSYSGRWEIINAIRDIAQDVVDSKMKINEICDTSFDKYLNTRNFPDPELLIRTSGEYRISNFLLWQIAYAELYFTETLWPDFRREDFYKAIVNFQNRERRFGKISEQICE
jgi:undecaprenyl diphosphate synthase